MRFTDANLKIISDSRGNDTLEAELKSGNFSATASVPAGKSRGTHEAFVLEPKKALGKFEEIRGKVLEKEFSSRPYIPGVSGDMNGVMEILREVGLFPKNGR